MAVLHKFAVKKKCAKQKRSHLTNLDAKEERLDTMTVFEDVLENKVKARKEIETYDPYYMGA